MVTLINNHVLLPFGPQWKHRPDWSRGWQNEVESGILGNETRFALRAAPRASLSFTILARELNELSRLDDAVRAAKKSGLACAPFHGRSFTLAEDTLLDEVTLTRNWLPSFASFLFLSNDSGFEVREITGYAGNVLTLDDVVSRTYKAGTLCWPLIFGKFSADKMAGRTPDHAQIKLTIAELVSPLSTQLGEVTPPEGVGIGVMIVEDDFIVA